MKYSSRFLIVCMMLLFSGCAAPTVVKPRFFWPIGGENPKIEYIGFYEADRDIKHPESPLAQAILGTELGRPLFDAPHGIGSRGDGVFAVTDPGLNKVVICDLPAGEIRWLKKPTGETYAFSFPVALVYRPDGGGYVADTATSQILQFNSDEVVVGRFGKKAGLNRPNGLAYDPANQQLYVADTLNHQIAVFSAAGKLIKRIGKRGIGEVEFNFPLDIALAPDGDLVVLDALNARVQVLHPDGTFVRMFGERGTAVGSFKMPKALAVDGFGHIYVTDAQANRFVIFDLQGNYLLSIGGRSVLRGGQVHPGGLDLPKGVAADPDGKIWIVDSLSRMVHRFQFLSDDYLKRHPLTEGKIFIPEGLR